MDKENGMKQNPSSVPPSGAQAGEAGFFNNISKHISSRTLLLIITLAGFAAFFIILAIMPSNQGNQKQITLNKAPTPTPVAQTSLSLQSLDDATISAGKSGTLQVMIDTNYLNAATAMQLELSFDPTVISNIDIKPGTFFPQPQIELIKNIDLKNGMLSYAIGIGPKAKGIKGKGIAAIISYQISPKTTETQTTFIVHPKSLVTADGTPQSVLKNVNGITLNIAK